MNDKDFLTIAQKSRGSKRKLANSQKSLQKHQLTHFLAIDCSSRLIISRQSSCLQLEDT